MQTEYDLYSKAYDSYENFKSRTANLSSLNASSYRGLISEFNSKISQLNREYANREREVNQQISNRFNSLKTGKYDALNDLAAALHQNQARKNLEKEKRQAENKLRREKEKKVKVFVERFKRDVKNDRAKALQRAKYAINKEEENYFTKLYSYFNCLYNDPYGAMYNQTNCSEPRETRTSSTNANYSSTELYEAYKRKKNSRFQEIRDEANSFLEMAIRKNPNNPEWLYEKAKISTNTSESLSLLNKAVKLKPDNQKYRAEQSKVQKKRYGELGEIGDKVNGKKHGKWVEYWSDGEVKQVVNYANGKITGDYLVFFDSDWKQTNDRNKNDYYSVKTYDKNGVKSLKAHNFYKSGKLQMVGQYEDKDHKIETGEFIYYHENGKISAIKSFANGKIVGESLEYYDNGQLQSKSLYKEGKLYSLEEIYNPDGTILAKNTYKDGEGYIPAFDEDMRLKSKSFYKNGIRIEYKNYSNNDYYRVLLNNKGVKQTFIKYFDKTFKVRKELGLYHNDIVRQRIGFDKNKNITALVFYNENEETESIFTNFKKENEFLYYEGIAIMEEHENGLIKSFLLSPPADLSYTRGDISVNGKKEYVVWTTTPKGLLSVFQVYKRRNNKPVKGKFERYRY